MVLRLRSYAHLSRATVSQRPLTNKVDDSKYTYIQYVFLLEQQMSTDVPPVSLQDLTVLLLPEFS